MVALATQHHVLPTIPDRAWSSAASGVLRTLDPPLELLPKAFLVEQRASADGAAWLSGDVVALPACKDQFAVVALRKGKPPPAPTDVAELRINRQKRRDMQLRQLRAWATTPFRQAGFACTVASAQAMLAAQPDPDPVAPPGSPTPTALEPQAARESRLWRQASAHFLQGLDAHGSILPTALFTQLEQEAAQQQAVDVGLVLGRDGGQVMVIHVARTGPAAAAGMRRGWVVTAIDGNNLAGLPDADLNRLLDGKAGTKVRVMALRPDAKRPKKLTLVRTKLVRSTITGKVAGESSDVAVVAMGAFATGSARGIRDALADVQMETGRPPQAIVLDFRGNSGGWVKEATDVADLFLGDALVASQHYRDGAPRLFKANVTKDDLKFPVALLVDGECRSSCELVTAALQDNDRAVVLGQPTFGKGSVQAVIDAKQGPWSVLVTIATYRSPRGRSLQGLGVEPDIALALARGQAEPSLREADLPSALRPDEQVAAHRSRLATPTVAACAASKADESVVWRKQLQRNDPWLLSAIDAVGCVGH